MTVHGDKPHLVLLPGMLCDEALFAHQLSHLSGAVAEMTVGDLSRDDSVAGMARSVLRGAPDRFALAGLSLGGIVAFEVMRQAPERVERLALLDTNARPPTPQQLESWREFARMTDEGRFVEVTSERLMPALIHEDRQDEADLTDAIVGMAKNIGEEAFLRQLSAQASRPDSRGGLGDISCPTAVIFGRQDALCTREMHEEIQAAIPGAVLVPIEGCGHLSALERPEAVTALLSYWLQTGG